MRRRSLLLMPIAAIAQTPTRRLQGRWVAQMGARQFSGTWTAEPMTSPADVGGLWQIVNERGEISESGEWSARKRESAWDGGWWAKPSSGAPQTGRWAAKTELAATIPMIELLASAAKTPATGTWTSAQGRRGTWTIWTDGGAHADTPSESK